MGGWLESGRGRAVSGWISVGGSIRTEIVLFGRPGLQARRLVERVAVLPGNAGRPQLLRWLLAIGAIFVAWRVWRGLKRVFRVAFGLGMALYWTGFWRVVFQDAVQGGRA